MEKDIPKEGSKKGAVMPPEEIAKEKVRITIGTMRLYLIERSEEHRYSLECKFRDLNEIGALEHINEIITQLLDNELNNYLSGKCEKKDFNYAIGLAQRYGLGGLVKTYHQKKAAKELGMKDA